MSRPYTIRIDVRSGPLRDEPLAIELHNTLYAAGGTVLDGLRRLRPTRGSTGLADRLPAGAGAPGRPAPRSSSRCATRCATALHAAVGRQRRRTAAALDRAQPRERPRAALAARRSGARRARRRDRLPRREPRRHRRRRLRGGRDRPAHGPARDADLRTCGAPGCVLMFLKHHPRREWCSNACGNRARQARHYDRTRRPDPL